MPAASVPPACAAAAGTVGLPVASTGALYESAPVVAVPRTVLAESGVPAVPALPPVLLKVVPLAVEKRFSPPEVVPR